MTLYTFYPCRAGGAPFSLETYELGDDRAANALLAHILRDHSTAVSAMVWEGDRLVAVRHLGARGRHSQAIHLSATQRRALGQAPAPS